MKIEDGEAPLFDIKLDPNKIPEHELADMVQIFLKLWQSNEIPLAKNPEPMGGIVVRVLVDLAKRVDLQKQVEIAKPSEREVKII